MDIYQAIAEPTRRKIIETIASQGEMQASDIYRHFDTSNPAISQHLKVLKNAKLVKVKKDAQKRLYSLNKDPFVEVDEWMQKLLRQWEGRFKRIDDLIKSEK